MRTPRIITLILLILLFASSIFFLSLQSFGALIGIATGILFIYYLLLYIFLKMSFRQKPYPKIALILFWILFLTPMVWALINPEGLFEFLLPNLHIDMK